MSNIVTHSNIYVDLKEIKQLIKNIQSSYQKLDNKQVQKEVQKEISKLVVLLQRIEKLILRNAKRRLIQHELSILVDFLELAVESLLQTVPNLHFAESIRTEIERVVYRYEHPILGFTINRFIDAYRSPSTSVKVLFGLITATLLYGTITLSIIGSLGGYLLWYSNFNDTGKKISEIKQDISKINVSSELGKSPFLQASINTKSAFATNSAAIIGSGINPSLAQKQVELSNMKRLRYLEVGRNIELIRQLVWAISAGTLGSIISILIRVEEFQGRKYSEPLVPFLTGFFKPIIGASFGILFFTLINSQLIVMPGFSDKEAGNKREFLIFAICFVVGFSERLARDAIGKAENIIGGSQVTIQSRETTSSLEDSNRGIIAQKNTQEDNIQLKQEANLTTSDTLIEAKKIL